MQIILASAKIMNDRSATKGDACQSKKVKSSPDISLSSPRFQNEADCFARDMIQYSVETIAEMLGCSQQIASQNRLRFMRFFEDAHKLPAILAYHGYSLNCQLIDIGICITIVRLSLPNSRMPQVTVV